VSPTAESLASSVARYSEPMIHGMDRSISYTLQGINEHVLRPVQARTEGKLAIPALFSQAYSTATSEVSKSYEWVIEYSNDKVDSWLPESGDDKGASEVTLGYVVTKFASRSHKRAATAVSEIPQGAKSFASAVFVKVQKFPGELNHRISGYVVEYSNVLNSKSAEMRSWTLARRVEAADYLETTRFLLSKKFSEGYGSAKSMVVFAANEEFMHRASKVVSAVKELEAPELPKYVVKKLQRVILRRIPSEEDSKFNDVELQLLGFFSSLGGLLYLESLVKGQASA